MIIEVTSTARSQIPPALKPAYARRVQLTDANLCALFGKPARPAICRRLRPEPAMCGANCTEAMRMIAATETFSAP
jgi:uncharacterized protein